MKRYVSGIRATGGLQLGNYLGALKNWVRFSNETDAEFLFFVADLHAITTPYERENLADHTREIVACYIACGLDVNKAVLFPQSAVMEHAMLQWALASVTPLGWLNRMTQFKEKAGKQKDNASLGLYSYPVLQAADVLLYKGTHVPVGEDQKQHIELARDIAGAFNRFVGEDFFPLPEPLIVRESARIMSLRDGTKKMSKSDPSDMSRINLTDDADAIAQKIRKAKTDPLPVPESLENMEERAEAKNLITIYAALSDSSKEKVIEEFGGKPFSEFKTALADLCVSALGPIAGTMRRLLADPAEIDRILRSGADKAQAIATPVSQQAMKKLGFWS